MKNWNCGTLQPLFEKLYGGAAAKAPARFTEMERRFFEYFGEGDYRVFSAPGRSEIGGNHTDHNYGKVLACAVSVDTVAFVRPTPGMTVRCYSEGHNNGQPYVLDLSSLEKVPVEEGTTYALIRGVADRMAQLGYTVGGFDAYITSDVLRGSGLSSSAAFEVLIGAVLDGLYNRGDMPPVLRAQIAQYAENVHFGKPSGLMDQTASSVGAMVTIDFEDPARPVVERVDFDFTAAGYSLVVVDTGGSHDNLTDAYASITREMGQVAAFFGQEKLRQVGKETFMAQLTQLPGKVSDRAILRAIHFFNDNVRVEKEVAALKAGDVRTFLENVIASGESSWKLLQNVYVGGSDAQGLALALAVTEPFLKGVGAWRVHGGGFAGTIQAFVPQALLKDYVSLMDALFHEGAATVLAIRPQGATEIALP